MNEAAREAARFLKSTLKLPSSKFPPRPPPADLANYISRCTDELFAWQREARPSIDTFTLHDGPPYANGDLHVGHALNKIVKDMICRTKLAQGKRIDFVPGWDCHGLPIELKALEKHGWQRGQGIDPVAIRKAARKFASDTVKTQMKSFRSWGVMADWERHWKTMDKTFELRQLAVFKSMVQNGLIYRKYKPVYWSPSSRTALAEAEVEYDEDFRSTMAIIKFPLHGKLSDPQNPLHAVIWTTTPWTIPANQAIAVRRDFLYTIVQSQSQGKLVVAASRLGWLKTTLGEPLPVLGQVMGTDLIDLTYSNLSIFAEHGQNRPIYHADYVRSDSGTGLVHCAPGHGKDDFEALEQLISTGHVQVHVPVDDQGKFTAAAASADPTQLAGLSVFEEGTAKMLELLRQSGMLLASSKYKHKYFIDWRTKEPIMWRATAQWFADVSKIKDASLSSLEQVTFKPETGASRLRSFISTRSEWCISRQRAWGVPIPALYHRETDEAVLTPDSIDHIVAIMEERGTDAWWSNELDDPAWIPHGLDPQQYRRGTDTMDVWFDSGTSWASMLDAREPATPVVADVYLEGSDQHRGWFQSSLLTGIAYQQSVTPNRKGLAPFRTLLTHGFTLDANERKMSKSVGNVIAPGQIIEGFNNNPKALQSSSPKSKQRIAHGPDALRLWAASSDWIRDVVISEQVVSTVHTNLDKFRVTIKLLLGMLGDLTPDKLLPYHELYQLDQLALHQLARASNSVHHAFEQFEFHKAITVINRWLAADLSGFYLEAIKDVVYCDSIQSRRRKSAQTTLFHIFSQLQQMLAPVTPLLVEESYAHSSESLREIGAHPLRRLWQYPHAEWQEATLASQLEQIAILNATVKSLQERARSEKLLGQSLASEVLVRLPPSLDQLQKISDDTLKELMVVSRVSRLSEEDVDQLDLADAEQVATIWKSSSGGAWAFAHIFDALPGQPPGFVVVKSPCRDKCARCWKYEVVSPSVQDKDTPHSHLLCQRCDSVVQEHGGFPI